LGNWDVRKIAFRITANLTLFSKITFEGQFWLVAQLKTNGSISKKKISNFCNKLSQLTIMDIFILG